DRHCVSCHNAPDSPGNLNLSGRETRLFNESYENLVPERRINPQLDRDLLGLVVGENHPKTGNIHYLPPYSMGSYTSVLVAMFSPDITLGDPLARKRAEHLAAVHDTIRLQPAELLKITNWVDTNCQYYGTYYGKRHVQFKGSPGYREEYDTQTALSPEPPEPFTLVP
ncbi:MAG: hypothetical protein LBQ78_04125, partial [Tannerellaceae bacterium]|nr:hypothetical protein [Tannerellaceae bacterium]